MNYKPQTLPAFSFAVGSVVLMACFHPVGFAQEAGNAEEKTPQPPAAVEPAATQASPADANAAPLPAADDILNQARNKLEGLNSLQADLSQTTLISGMKLQATGHITEAAGDRVNLLWRIGVMTSATVPDQSAMALDAPAPEIKEADNRGLLIQISNGKQVYTDWKNGEKHIVNVRDIARIQEAAAGVENYSAQSVAMDLGVGGIRGVISRIQSTMVFAPVKLVKAGDRSFYEVSGRWNDHVRKNVFALPEGTVVDSRPFVPEYVRIYVDQETLLLRRIQFLKRSLDPSQKMVRPLLTLDFRNLKLNETVDEALFTYTPPDSVKTEDQTDLVVEAIKASVAKPETAEQPAPGGTNPTPPAEK